MCVFQVQRKIPQTLLENGVYQMAKTLPANPRVPADHPNWLHTYTRTCQTHLPKTSRPNYEK